MAPTYTIPRSALSTLLFVAQCVVYLALVMDSHVRAEIGGRHANDTESCGCVYSGKCYTYHDYFWNESLCRHIVCEKMSDGSYKWQGVHFCLDFEGVCRLEGEIFPIFYGGVLYVGCHCIRWNNGAVIKYVCPREFNHSLKELP